MTNEILGDRRKALEEEFFARQNAILLRRLAEDDAARTRRERLSAASGITDPAALDQLEMIGAGPETMAAIALVPLVVTAWADGKIDDQERSAVLSAATENGLAEEDIAFEILEEWLEEAPPPTLLEAWKAYIAALVAPMDASARQLIREQTLGRARWVAAATGGFLGLGNRISAREEAVLDDLARAFEGKPAAAG